jgi:hypothetical protein
MLSERNIRVLEEAAIVSDCTVACLHEECCTMKLPRGSVLICTAQATLCIEYSNLGAAPCKHVVIQIAWGA